MLGDLEYLAKSWGLANPGALNPCSLCRANKSDLPWTDARATASWRATTWTEASWVAAHPNRSELFRKVPGLTIHAYVPDIMHTLHLGAYSYMLGSILKHLVMHHMGGSVKKNCEDVWAELDKAYKDVANLGHQSCLRFFLWHI